MNFSVWESDFMQTNLENSIASFQVDHTKLKPGLYTARIDGFGVNTVTTLDLRFTTPNSELDPPSAMAGLHTIEHLGAVFLRNHSEIRNEVIYFGPMGCRTGCYAIFFGNHSLPYYTRVFEEMSRFILDWNDAIPGATPEECGNFRDHNLLAAKAIISKWLSVLTRQRNLSYDPFHYPT